jgi:hypothetical protein
MKTKTNVRAGLGIKGEKTDAKHSTPITSLT